MTRWHGDMSSLQYSYHISPLWHVTSLKPSSFFWRDNHGPQMARSHGNEAVYGPAGHCRADDLTTWSSPRIDVFLLVKNPEFRYVSEGFNYFNGCFWQIENSWVSGANSILFFLGCSPPKRGRPKHQKKTNPLCPSSCEPRDFPPLGKLNLPFLDSTKQTLSWRQTWITEIGSRRKDGKKSMSFHI